MKVLETSHPLVKSVIRQMKVILTTHDERIIAELVTATLPFNRIEQVGPGPVADIKIAPAVPDAAQAFLDSYDLVGGGAEEPAQAQPEMNYREVGDRLAKDQNIAHGQDSLCACVNSAAVPAEDPLAIAHRQIGELGLSIAQLQADNQSRTQAWLRQQDTIQSLQKQLSMAKSAADNYEKAIVGYMDQIKELRCDMEHLNMDRVALSKDNEVAKLCHASTVKSIRMVLDGHLRA